VDLRAGFGSTALHYAASNGKVDTVKALVIGGSDLAAMDGDGR